MHVKLKMHPEGLGLKGLSSPDKSPELTLHRTSVTQVTNFAPGLAALKGSINSLEEQINLFDFTSAESAEMAKSEDSSLTKRVADVEKRLHLLGITSDFTKRLELQLDLIDVHSDFMKRLANVEKRLADVEQQLYVRGITSDFPNCLADLEKQVADWDASDDEDSDSDDEDDNADEGKLKAWKDDWIEENAKKQESVDDQLTFLREKVFSLERENADIRFSMKSYAESFRESHLQLNMAVSRLQYVERQYQREKKAAKERDEAEMLETLYMSDEEATVIVLDE